MPKRFPPPKPADDPVDAANPHPAGASSDDPWPAIRELAAAGDEDGLSELLATEGLGGRPVAKLLIHAWLAMDRYAPEAEQIDEFKQAAEAATRRKDAARRFMPTTLEECAQQAETVEQAIRDWGRATNAAGEAERAQSHVAFLRQQFPELFAVEPECLLNREGEWTPRVLGAVPPELQIWFAARGANPREYGSWRTVGVEAPEKRRKIVSVPSLLSRR